MAHGSKKWVVCYDGHLKKSNDRTKKDYYRGLKRWEPYEDRSQYHYRYARRKDYEFCPQCKHNFKPIKAYNEALRVERETLEAAWDQMHQKEIEAYEIELAKWKKNSGLNYHLFEFRPRDPRAYGWDRKGESRYEYVRTRMGSHGHPIRDEECYLCPKHRRNHDVKNQMWRNRNSVGGKADCQYTVRQDFKNYKQAVKNVMQRAKYDEDYYENIPIYKRGWLD